VTSRAVLLAIAIAAPPALGQSVVVAGGGRELTVNLAAFPRVTVEILDRTDGGARKHVEGVWLGEVLTRLAPPRGTDALAVRCDDGWLTVLPLATVRAHHGLLALGLAPPRGPVFLTWPQESQPEVDRDPALNPNGWTWAVARLEFVRAADFRIALPDGAAPAAREGAVLFERHCQHCHAFDGRGGMAGWDLARPPILAVRGERYVRDYLHDPRSRNPSARMPSFASKLKSAEVRALLALLAAAKPLRTVTLPP
jgi:mono/diheme cytochrome c family protein